MSVQALESLNFDNRTLQRLPIDPDASIVSRPVRGACFSRVQPAGVSNPKVVAVSDEALQLLGLPANAASLAEFAQYFSGNKLLPGSEPAAHCYCGHQFGNFAGQLGDGAAMYLGEVVNERGERWELQLKGAGPTPYSRQGDGHKVLRSSIREFLCSEAMHHLGIPTTRAGSVVTSDTRVERDMFYDGRPKLERVTVVSRIAPTFLRFGSFEIFKKRDEVTGREGPSAGLEKELLPQMVDFTIQQYYPHIWEAHGGEAGARNSTLYHTFFREVVERTASLVALWQSVGFCHGVLNTDNMSIVGVTIDYGPFGFMDRFDPEFICNSSDDSGRYDYKSQPAMCAWNCGKLAEALRPLLDPEVTDRELDAFDEVYHNTWLDLMRKKLGLLKATSGANEDEDRKLVEALLDTMAATGSDFTATFRSLASFPLPPPTPSSGLPEGHQYNDGGLLDELVAGGATPQELARGLQPRIPPAQLQMLQMLAAKEPGLLRSLGVPTELLASEEERQAKAAKLRELTPEQKVSQDRQRWSAWLQRYGRRLQQEADTGASGDARVVAMNGANPRLVLRNWMAQVVIEKAEEGDYSQVEALVDALRRPFDDSSPLPTSILEHLADGTGQGNSAVAPEAQGPPAAKACARLPSWAAGLRVSCSS